MEFKNIVATLYLKDGQAVRSMEDFTIIGDVYELCQLYNDSGIDKIIIFDLSTDEKEHEKNINTIKNINRNIEIKVCAGGNINQLDDIKKLMYAGCLQVIINATKPSSLELADQASARFGKDRVLLSVNNVDSFPDIIIRAYNLATTGRKGGVVIDFPFDIEKASINSR